MKKPSEYGVLFLHYLGDLDPKHPFSRIKLEIKLGPVDQLKQMEKKECRARAKAQRRGTGWWHWEGTAELALSLEEQREFQAMLQNPLTLQILRKVASAGFEMSHDFTMSSMAD